MRKILAFLATDGAFLYEERGFRIVDSEYINAFGGVGSVTLRSDAVELIFWLDRDRLFMDMRGAGPRSCFSLDILQPLITGEVSDKALVDRETMEFLRQHLDQLQDLFSRESLEATEARGEELKIQRAKRLFG